MSQKPLRLHEIEDELELLFGLSDGEQSDDGNESDEAENEAIFLETTQEELEGILDSPSTSSSSTRNQVANSRPDSAGQPSSSSSSQPPPDQNTEADISLGNNIVLQAISDSEEDDDDDNWKKVYFTHNPPIEKFDDMPLKPKQNFPPRSSPLAYFSSFFSDDVITHIVEQTNLYASQNQQKHWSDINKEEWNAFIGVLILMGVHPLPNIDLYWSTDPFFLVTEIANVMTSKRFKMILKNLHLNDNTKMPKWDDPNFDKLYKMRPILDMMNSSFQNSSKNSSSQSIDECMVKFKGRSSLKQYMPKKPVKRGFKIWARCDSLTGYLYEFEVYTGKKGTEVEKGLGSAVVKRLCKTLIDEKMEHIHVAFDNFFSSAEVMQELFEQNIYTTATVRVNRTNLPGIVKKTNKSKQGTLKLSKGQYKWRVNKNVSFFAWMDTKLVTILSTAFHPKYKVTCKRTQKDGNKQEVPCPLGVLEYTKRMGGVDRFDQKRGTYPVARKSRKWWMRLFYFVLDAAITNAYILYSQKTRYPMNNLQFRTMLGRNLIGFYTSRKRSISAMPFFVTKRSKPESRQKTKYGIPDETRLHDVGSHLPGPLESFRRCRACSSKENSKKSRIQCIKCKVALCVVPCFADFHKA